MKEPQDKNLRQAERLAYNFAVTRQDDADVWTAADDVSRALCKLEAAMAKAQGTSEVKEFSKALVSSLVLSLKEWK